MIINESHGGGQYCLTERIARGGMAEIYKGLAYDVAGLKRTVCIKKILPEIAANREFIDALVGEAKVAVTLSHGNIAQVYDLGKSENDYYIVMEFVDGKSLSQINKRAMASGTYVPATHACFIISEVLAGLDYVHRRLDENGKPLNIVHRDVSPQNIMVSFAGTVKVIDFGIAKAAIRLGVTETGVLKGKFAYMSPEQARGEPLDNRSDIFSLGIVFHEILTGRRLFKADDSRETLRNVRKGHVVLPSQLRPELPPELDEIVMRSLAKERSRRYPTAAEMRDDLVRFLYSNFADYQPSELSSYVRNLFVEEMPAKPEPKESHTPAIIVDGTHSALQAEKEEEITGSMLAKINIKEYIPLAAEESEENVRDGGIDLNADLEKEEKTSFIRKKWNWAALLGAFAICASAAFLIYRATRGPSDNLQGMKYGQAVIITNPLDAQVFVDGRLVGSGSPVAVERLSESEHELVVMRSGYITHNSRFYANAGEVVSKKIVLSKQVADLARIEIASEPPGAVIYINDVQTSSKTPATIEELKPDKPYTIGLHRPGYLFWKKAMILGGGQTLRLEVVLQKDFATISVKSVPEDALVMIDGAPVGETPWQGTKFEADRKYKIEVWKEGYDPQSKEVELEAGREFIWEPVLEKTGTKK